MRNAKRKSFFLWICYSAAFLILVLIIYGFLIEPHKIEIHHVWIQDSDLARILEDKVVVQLSDLHMSGIGKREHKILEILNELDPDIVLLTGDYVLWKGDNKNALKFLSQLRGKIGVWAVMGDYDFSNSRKSCEFCHEQGTGKPTSNHSVRFLKNSKDDVRLPDGLLRIAGVDGEENNSFDIKRTFLMINNEPATIILSHSPLNFDLIDNNQKVLMLAGDTHGGQVPLPGWFFTMIGYKKNSLYSQGLFEQGQKKMFVSRGIGTSHIPMRLFRLPEIVVLHFQK